MKPNYDDVASMEDRTLRPRDGIVTGARESSRLGRGQARATWVVVARNDEIVEDFFLESPFGPDQPSGEDPTAWICRGLGQDGTVRMGEVNLDVDRFVSDVLNDELRAAFRKRRG